MLAITAYIVRGLQLVLGSSKRAITERAEELGVESDAIPLNEFDRSRQSSITFPTPLASTQDLSSSNLSPHRAHDPTLVRGSGILPTDDISSSLTTQVRAPTQAPLPLTRPQRWAFTLNTHLDSLTYTILFLFVGLPIYYTTGYAMPAQLTLNILAYFAAVALPVKWKQFLHPVLVASGITVLGVWIMGLMRGDGLREVLKEYKQGIGYLAFWEGGKGLGLPGMLNLTSALPDCNERLLIESRGG